MVFDRNYEPIVAGNQMFVGSSWDDSDIESGESCGKLPGPLAFDDDGVYLASSGAIRSLSSPPIKITETKDRRGRKKTVRSLDFSKQHFSVEAASLDELIRVGSRFYGAKDNHIYAIDMPDDRNQGKPSDDKISWQTEVDGRVVRLLAADDRLFAVTLEGRIYCFGAKKTEATRHKGPASASTRAAGSDVQRERVTAILQASKIKSGHCMLWGIGDGGLATELINQSDLFIVAVDPDAEKVKAARQRFADAGVYGRRISLLVGDPRSCHLPPYLARLMVAVEPDANWLKADKATAQKMYAVLRC